MSFYENYCVNKQIEPNDQTDPKRFEWWKWTQDKPLKRATDQDSIYWTKDGRGTSCRDYHPLPQNYPTTNSGTTTVLWSVKTRRYS